jgi:hypothetical protein
MDVLHLVVHYQTSKCVWRTLEQTLSSSSNSCIMKLNSTFQYLHQGDDSVTIFMQKVKALFNELGVVSQPVLLKDFNFMCFLVFRVSSTL